MFWGTSALPPTTSPAQAAAHPPLMMPRCLQRVMGPGGALGSMGQEGAGGDLHPESVLSTGAGSMCGCREVVEKSIKGEKYLL